MSSIQVKGIWGAGMDTPLSIFLCASTQYLFIQSPFNLKLFLFSSLQFCLNSFPFPPTTSPCFWILFPVFPEL